MNIYPHDRHKLTAIKLTCPCNSLRKSNSFPKCNAGVVIDSEPHLSCTCNTSFLFAPLAVRVHTDCSAFPFCTPTKPLIRLNIKYKILCLMEFPTFINWTGPFPFCLFVCFCCFTSHVNSYGHCGRSVHLTTLFPGQA